MRVTVGGGGQSGNIYNRGFELLGSKLQAFRGHAEDMSEPLGAIGESIHLQVSTAFATQGANVGGWQALSEPYGAWKQKHVSGIPKLIGLKPTGGKGARPQSYTVSGRMRLSLLDPVASHVTPHRLLYAPDSDYAGYHEYGTSKMPARPPLAITPETLHSWDRSFVVWINKLIKEQGL